MLLTRIHLHMYPSYFLSLHGPAKCKREKDLQQWECAKRRQIQKEKAASIHLQKKMYKKNFQLVPYSYVLQKRKGCYKCAN